MSAPTFQRGQCVREKATGRLWWVSLILPANVGFGATLLCQDYPHWTIYVFERCFRPEEVETV